MDFIYVPKYIPWHEFAKKDLEKIKLILFILITNTHLAEYTKSSNPLFWRRIPISRTTWKTAIGAEYAKLLEKLKHCGIIGIGDSYSNNPYNARPKTYWLTDNFINEYERVFINDKTSAKINILCRTRFLENVQEVEVENIDKTHYLQLENIIWTRLGIEIKKEDIGWLKEWSEPDYDGIMKKMRPQDWWLIDNIKNKQCLGCSIGRESWRFFSPITQGRFILRQFLRGDEEPLFNIDIRCSQPTFIGLLVRDVQGDMKNGLVEYFDLIENPEKDLYEYIGTKLGLEMNKQTRDYIKKEFFHTLYGPIKSDDKIYKIIQTDFPAIAKTMWNIKNGKSFRKQDYGKFSIEMMRAEAKFIIGEVLEDIWKYDPNIFVITIHDSVMVKRDDVDVVSNIIKKRFEKRHIRPVLHIE